MASFLTDLGKTYVEKLINGAIAESRNICCFTCIANDFEEERSRLEIESTTVKQRVDVATRRGEEVQANVLFWEKEADELIQEDTKTNQKCLFGFCPHIIWRYKRGKELTNKKEQIKRLIQTGKQLSIELPARLPDVERYSSQHYISFESRESKYKELLDALKDDNNYITGLQGMGGTGKTTLAKEVGKELKQSKQFTSVIDTTVSSSVDIRKIQNDIAGPLDLKFNDCTESDRPKKLWKRLTNGEKILLILDDVWGDIDFNEIGIPYSDNHKGCRILVTTRSLLVCNILECSKIIQLELLSDEEAWNMFQRHAGLNEISTKSLLDKGRKIANECRGLPIAIAVIASSLKGIQSLEEWEWALKSLQKPMHGVDDELVKIYKRLQVSYDNMKNEKARRLLLLCSVFREDEEIPTERLTRLGIGGGLFGEDYVSYEYARTQFVISKNKLLDSCLLLEANQNRAKMHDLVRDAAQWIANKEIQTVKLYDKNKKAVVEREANIKYLLCEGKLKDVFSFKLDGSKLEILIVIVHKDEDCQNVKIEVPNSFFENIMGLRVFHLIHHHYSKLDLSLPHSIQSLKNIRSLLFTCVNLGDISILGNLQSLETLDLDGCKIDELPHGIRKLEKLKLLNLKDCGIARNNPFEVIEGCSSLEELYFTGSFNDFCKEITFPKLRRFNIDEHPSSVVESSSKHVSVLFNDKLFLSETTLKYCMQEAKVLRLRRIEGEWKNIIPEIVPMDQGMNDIVELSLKSISQLQCLIDTKHTESQVSKVFSKLVVLNLWNLENLEELFNGPLSFDSLNCLEKLSIYNCKHLKSLFQIIDDGRSCDSMFQKLEVLRIKKCPELETILPFLSAHDLPALDSITIKRCDKLKYIFGQDVQLGSLKKMKLGGIPNFIDIFPECNRTMSLSIKKPSSISGDASEPQEQSEPIKCNIYCCGKNYGHRLRTKTPLVSKDQQQDNLMKSNSYCLNIWERVQCLSIPSYILCNIKHITLSNIPKMKSVFILSIAPRMLLETLRIRNCDELKHIIIHTGNHDNTSGTVFPKLTRIEVEDCEQLKNIIGQYTDDHQNRTEIHLHLPVLEAFVLHNLPSLVSMCPKQYHTTFPHLKKLELNNCRDGKIIKELSGKWNVDHFLALEILRVKNNSKVESIICLNEINEQQMNLALKDIGLDVLPMMTYLFVGPKNSFSLQNLTRIKIKRCEKLKFVFSTSIIRWLPQLLTLRIEECNELKHIIEDDLENKKPSNVMSTTKTCFPKLGTLVVEKCNKLNHVFPISICKELPNLGALVIREADELEEIFVSESDDHKVEIPNLKYLAFENLPSLSHAQGIQFQPVKYRLIQNCQKLSLASASTADLEIDLINLSVYGGREFSVEMRRLFGQLLKVQATSEITEVQATFGHELTSSKKEMEQTPETEHELVENVPQQEMPSVAIMPTNSEELMNEQQMEQQRPLRKTDATVKPSQKNNLEGSTSEKNVASTLSTISGTTKNELPIPADASKQKGIKISVEDGTTSANAKTIKSSPGHLSTSNDKTTSKGINVDLGNSKETPHTKNNQVSLNDDAFMKVSSKVEEQFRNDDEIKVSKSKPSSSIPSPIASQFPSVPSKAEVPPRHELTSSEEFMNEQQSLGAIDTTIKSSQENNVSEISVEEVTTSANAKTKTSTQEEGDSQRPIAYTPIAITKPLTTQDVNVEIWQETSNTNDDQVSLNDDNVTEVSSNTEDQFSKDDDILVSKSRPSSIASQFPSKPSEGDPSQIDEDLSSSVVVTRELENLVSKKHLAIEKLSLLTDFLVKHPSVLLRDTSLSSKYKSYAYNSLADLLKFLQTQSVLDVLGSSNSEFVELLQDVHRFPFDKEWLDDVEKRALFPDLQFSQNALQKLLDSEQRVTKEVEEMRLKINIFNQHVEDLKHQLTSSEAALEAIIQQKVKILETKAALSAPLGY